MKKNLQQHQENLLSQEERIRAEIRQRFRRAGDVDTLFTTFTPHIPLLFMQVQDDIRRERLKMKCPEKEVGGFKALTDADFSNPGAMNG